MSQRLLSIILCGKKVAIGSQVIAGLKPEYEVIEFVTSAEEGCVVLPKILQGQGHLVSTSNGLGTHNYSVEPQGIMLGAGFEEADVQKMMDACKGEDIRRVLWLRARRPENVNEKLEPGTPAYIQAFVERAKACLHQLNANGKLRSADEIVWF
ncbi:hypothetical protein BT69DRAFT_1226079 [Atractiella rhizophila]|nr:hypothetical protein BT69DRAFT_1226079 [Atractiella rhizophila]